jgi:acyl carrier protein
MAAAMVILKDANVSANLKSITDEVFQLELFVDKVIKLSTLMTLELIFEIKDENGVKYPDKNFAKNIDSSQAAAVVQNLIDKQFVDMTRLRQDYDKMANETGWKKEDLVKFIILHPAIIKGE